MLRVGRIKYVGGKKVFPNPVVNGVKFKIIEVMTPSTTWGDLSPYSLKTREGYIMENVWQFSKVYEQVPKTTQIYSKYNPKIIWDHPEEKHYNPETRKFTPEYYLWRRKGFECEYAIRYPVGYADRGKCLFALTDTGKELGYIDARKQVYLPLYMNLVVNVDKFHKLKKMYIRGENLMIVEVDGPHQESLGYYQNTYGVSNDFITNDSMLVNLQNITIMLNDDKHPFGHGYCLAWTLMKSV